MNHPVVSLLKQNGLNLKNQIETINILCGRQPALSFNRQHH